LGSASSSSLVRARLSVPTSAAELANGWIRSSRSWGESAVGPRPQVLRGQDRVPAKGCDRVPDPRIVGRDYHPLDPTRRLDAGIDLLDQWLAGEWGKGLSWKAAGAIAGGNDDDDMRSGCLLGRSRRERADVTHASAPLPTAMA
jgi:hypothetical protein